MNLRFAISSLILVLTPTLAQDIRNTLSHDELTTAMTASPVWFGDTAETYGGHKNVKFQFGTNGYVIGRFSLGNDSGPWKVQDDQLCFTLRKWVFKEICSKVTANADGSYSLHGVFQGRKE